MGDLSPFHSFTNDTWLSLLRHHGGELRLSRAASTFDLTLGVCTNPTCPCEEVTLSFREQDPAPRHAAEAFDVVVDLVGDAPGTWKGLGAQAEATAAMVAAALSGPARAVFRAALREHRGRLARVPQTIAAFVAKGEMVPFAHVRAGGTVEDTIYADHLDIFEADDVDWSVLDFICCAPDCACSEVCLAFEGAGSGARVGFHARVPLGGGRPTFENLRGMKLADAERFYAEWETEAAIDRAILKARYDLARMMALQGGAKGRPPAPVRAPVVAPRSRRDPCPCGSGKRYKNCCGASAS